MPGQNTGMNTIHFIPQDRVPREQSKDVTFGLITCFIRPEKNDEPNRTRLVTGGDRVHYPGNAGTPTTNLSTIKLLINSIILTTGATLMMMGIKDFYLNTPMARYEHMRLKLSDMPDLAGNVGNMSATCRQRVDLSQILARHVCCVRHKREPDTYLSTFLCQGTFLRR
jgi:hypothetical protein